MCRVCRVQLILSPLENAIELIENRVAALRAQLTQNPPRLNALQSVIQGSVVTSTPPSPSMRVVCVVRRCVSWPMESDEQLGLQW